MQPKEGKVVSFYVGFRKTVLCRQQAGAGIPAQLNNFNCFTSGRSEKLKGDCYGKKEETDY
jgi:hypothetical protein